MATERFIGFYPSRPFWAVSSLNFNDPNTIKNFTELMSEEVISDQNDNFKIKICRDGMILLRIQGLELTVDDQIIEPIKVLARRWGDYLDYLNCLYFLVDSSTHKIQNPSYFNLSEITYKDAARIIFEDSKMQMGSLATESIVSIYQLARYITTYPKDIPIQLDWRLSNRQIIKRDVFLDSIDQFKKIIKNHQTIKMISGIAKSLSEYKIGNYDTSLILAWFVIETVLNSKWLNFLDSKNITDYKDKKRINSNRIKYFTGRDFPISLILNILEISDVINIELFEILDQIRGYRNKIIHSEPFDVKPEYCQLAIEKATKLALEQYDFTVTPNLSYTVTGF
jgi:hypothetical protein